MVESAGRGPAIDKEGGRRASSLEVYSMISVQRLEDLMVPRFFWFDLRLQWSLNSTYGVPVSTWLGRQGKGQKPEDKPAVPF